MSDRPIITKDCPHKVGCYVSEERPWMHPDKSMTSYHRVSEFADYSAGASIGNDFTNGHRGMAHAVKGAKKYVNSRFRFHEKQALRKLIKDDVE